MSLGCLREDRGELVLPNSNKTVLVVDDDAKIRKLLRNCLEADGYRVLEAATEAEVVDFLQQQHVDLITLDLQLGAENGLHIAATVREK